MSVSTLQDTSAIRLISYRSRGSGHGPIVRLMSPSDLGRVIKPFVFLDLFEGERSFLGQMPLHPHSGIATVTVVTEGDMHFDDPNAGTGTIDYGGVEWMRAGGGVWHGKEMSAGLSQRVQGFQLWVALPPELENAEVDSQYLESAVMPQAGPARVILGNYEGVQSPIRAPAGMNYLLVTIPAGEGWEYHPPQGHESLWLCVSRGALRSPYLINEGEMVVFEPGSQSVRLEAGNSDAVFVLGSASPHPYDLKLGNYSVHTSVEALRAGEANIREIGSRLTSWQQARAKTRSVPIFK
jgi:redox-sensitive bicupin YhaK (pirin superfamily)